MLKFSYKIESIGVRVLKKKNEKKEAVTTKQSKTLMLIFALFAFLVVIGIFANKGFKPTYSASIRTIQFRGDTNYDLGRYPGYNGPEDGICYTDEYGFLNPECAEAMSCVCSEWSNTVSTGSNTQPKDLYSSELYSKIFTSNETYYCISNTSGSPPCDSFSTDCYECTKDGNTIHQSAINVTRAKVYAGADNCNPDPVDDAFCNQQPPAEEACYRCTADETKFRWGTNGDGDSNCSGGYTKTALSYEDCKYVPPEEACYRCTADETKFRWGTNGAGDSNCSGGYTKTTLSYENCKYVPPEEACYRCTADATKFKWSTNGNGDSNCSGGYTKTTLSYENCKYVAPDACYQCKADETIFKWTNTDIGDTKCQGGYKKTTRTQAECKYVVPENPKTGEVSIIIAWVVGLLALGYSLFYVLKVKKD